ncbi:hypothetical protein F5144DRAFT_490165 [Chaetomium tenue]|uniref:Uncharacterized protein n=1 Tax=Chaetomium tenue TaxID=1854479 RepID=A0ACB7P786_9PEZI|nr:hypothetical protein F5144DRAFT_490165 [Chaetomium globosum]
MSKSTLSARCLGWAYCVVCYGGPLALALTHLHVKRPNDAAPHSDIEGWCWEVPGQEMLQVYIPVWGCIGASLIIYLGAVVRIIRRTRYNTEKWQRSLSARCSMSSTGPVTRNAVTSRDSVLSLSDWPLSPSSGGVFFGAQCAEAKASGRPRPVTYPSPTYMPSTLATDIWLHSAFAACPRPAPTPPPPKGLSVRNMSWHARAEDQYLWTGLMLAGSLLVTWLPGTISLGWKLTHPELPTPLGFRVVVAIMLPLQGLWVAGIFLALNWKEIRRGTIRPPSRTTISGLLEEPLLRLRGNSVSSRGTDHDVEKAKKDLKVAIPWNRQTKSDDWDFVDIGIPSRTNTVTRPRPNSEPVISPLLPSPAIRQNGLW